MTGCTADMFEIDNNYPLNEKTRKVYETRICPDAHAIKGWWKLKNEYSNHNDRKSFNVQAALCDNKTSEVPCAPREHTIYLLNRLQFTFYILEDYIQFGNIGETPYATINKFHS